MTEPAVPRRLGAQVTATIGCRACAEGRRWSAYWPSAAAVCATVLLMPAVFVLISNMRADRRGESGMPPAVVVHSLFGSDGIAIEQFAESVGTLLERPLATEVEELQKQTKSAVEFLMSCSGADLAIGRQAL